MHICQTTVWESYTVARYVSYLRVSTERQGRSGLGLDAQRATVLAFLSTRSGDLVSEHVEIESGKRSDRPVLAQAMVRARAFGATLVIARLDRLSRDAHFLLGLEKAGVDFVACDNPAASRLTVTILAAVAEEERRAISERTRAALAAAKARGVRLGNPNGAAHLHGRGNKAAVQAIQDEAQAFADRLRPILVDLQSEGVASASAIARELDARGIPTARGGAWSARAVINLQARLQAL